MTVTKEPTTDHYKKLIKILGKEYIKSKVMSPYDFIRIATQGLNANVISNFRTYFNIPVDTTAAMLNTSAPTLYRWTKNNKSLESVFSVKLFEVADLFLYGSEVFGDKANFFKWMNLPNTALGGLEPQELVVYSGGVSKVRNIIGRIEHGVYS